eukprot:2267245-Alexandrium_andersonii.AAC.1
MTGDHRSKAPEQSNRLPTIKNLKTQKTCRTRSLTPMPLRQTKQMTLRQTDWKRHSNCAAEAK